jgi:putative endonuclease
MSHIRQGKISEQKAKIFLEKKGFKFLAQNYRCFSGEIDLVMQDNEEIVFVEVRTRNHTDFGSAVDSVNVVKQRKLIKAAMHFLQKNNLLDEVDSRFDIIGISQDKIEWIKNAFTIENEYYD